MIFDNGWISVAEVDKLPPLLETCQVLVERPAGSFHVSTDMLIEGGWESFGDWQDLMVIAHQPLAALPTKQTLFERLAVEWKTTPATIRSIIETIDSERAKDTPFDAADMAHLRNCYAMALAYRSADEVASLSRAIDRLEVMA